MYAGLITAGASTLYDLYKSVTSSGASGTSNTAAFPSPVSASDEASGTSPRIGSTGPVTSSSSSGASSFSDALRKLFVDLQSNSGASSGVTSAAAGANPFQGQASPLLAYAKTQNLGAVSSTSLTA